MAVCACAPMRLAMPALVVLAFLNPSGPEFASATDLGVANAARIVLLPTFLLWRAGLGQIRTMSWAAVPRAWLFLSVYAIVACLWTPYQLPGAKMIGYFYAYSVTFLLFGIAWARGWLNPSVVYRLVWVALTLAVVQTFALGNLYGTDAARFTAFTSPQGFAAFLLCALSILMFQGRRTLFAWTTMAAAFLGIILSGSRYVFVGVAALVVIASVARLYGSGKGPSIAKLAWRGAIGIGLAVALFIAVGQYLPESRTAQLVNAIAGRSSLTQDIGTFAWRLGVYDAILTELQGRDAAKLLFGTGTSSGADLILKVDRNYQTDTVSANRVLHNEFLRVTYEWGVVGLALFLAFLGSLLLRAGRAALRSRSPGALAVTGILPGLIAGLAIENLLAGAGGSGGVGFTLVLAYGFRPIPLDAAPRRWRLTANETVPPAPAEVRWRPGVHAPRAVS
jgi:O-antigen ligase